VTTPGDVPSDKAARDGASTGPATQEVSPWWILAAVECGNFAVYMEDTQAAR